MLLYSALLPLMRTTSSSSFTRVCLKNDTRHSTRLVMRCLFIHRFPLFALEQVTEIHWKQCESIVDSRQACTTICQPERNSIQRKTMHQACLHGCQQAHVAATALSCRGKVTSEEKVFQEVGGLAYVHCAKFQATDPKPDAFATCRKYHRAGTKHGFRLGLDAINGVLDEEWQRTKENERI